MVARLGRLDRKEQSENSFRVIFGATRARADGPPNLHIAPDNVRIQMLRDAAVVTFEFDREGSSLGRRTVVFQKRREAWQIVHIHASNVRRR